MEEPKETILQASEFVVWEERVARTSIPHPFNLMHCIGLCVTLFRIRNMF